MSDSVDSNPKPKIEATHSVLSNLCDGIGKFGHAVTYEVAEAPSQALYQFANEATGKHLPGLEITKPDDSAWSAAGSFVGTVAKFAILSKLVHNSINSGEVNAVKQTLNEGLLVTTKNAAVEASLTGAAAGFLTPVASGKDYWTEKGIGVTTSAAAFGTMGATSAAMGRSSFMSSMNGNLGRSVAINGIAGWAGGTVESALDAKLHNRNLDLQQTVATAGSYALFGAAFGGVAHLAGKGVPEYRPELKETAPAPEGETGQRPTLKDHAQQVLQSVKERTAQLGSFIDESIYSINPLRGMNGNGFSGMQLAYEGAGHNPRPSTIRAYYPSSPNALGETQMMSVAHQPGRAVSLETVPAARGKGFQPTELETRKFGEAKPGIKLVADKQPVRAKAAPEIEDKATGKAPAPEKVAQKGVAGDGAKTFSIESVLAKTDRPELAPVLEALNDEHPSFLKGLKSKYANTIGGGRDSILIELADGKYKNAVLRFTTIFGQPQDTLTPNDWSPEWGKRPYDSPILSPVHEVEIGGGDRAFVYVQEKGEGAVKTDAFYDAYEDATFAKDANDPSFQQLMAELEERGEEFVDPGSRQLVWSRLKNRLVLVDYPAVMRSSEIPDEWRAAQDSNTPAGRNAYAEHNDTNEADYDDEPAAPQSHEVLDLSREELRYDFLRREGSPLIAMQNEIAQQIFDGDSEKDMLPLIDFMFKNALKDSKMTAREAIKSTKELLKKQKLI